MAVLASLTLTLSHLSSSNFNQRQNGSSSSSGLLHKAKSNPEKANFGSFHRRSLSVNAATEGSSKNRNKSNKKADDNSEDPSIPPWARQGSDELPPWATQQAQKESSGSEIPFYVYLIASAITAIAAVGSVFEYVNQKPVFGVLNYDSVFYAPLLGFFAFTGIPSSAFLWFKSVQVANKEAEEQDRRDGYL